MTTRTRALTAVAVALALLTASCGDSDGDEVVGADTSVTAASAATTSGAPAVTEPESADGSASPSTTADTGETEPQQVEQGWWPLLRKSREADMAHLVGDIEREQGAVAPFWLEPDRTYRTSQLGSTITFELPETMALVEENPAMIVLRFDTAAGRAGVLMTRPRGAYLGDAASDPAAPVSRLSRAAPLPEDFGTFFEEQPALVVDNTVELDLSGTAAVRYDIHVDAEVGGTYACQLGPRCVNTVLSGPSIGVGIVFSPDRSARVYEIEQPGGDIIIIVNADPDAQSQLDQADEVVASIVVEQPAGPLGGDLVWQLSTEVDPGTYRFAGIPNVEWDLEETLNVFNAFGAVRFTNDRRHQASLVQVAADASGRPVSSVSGLVEQLNEALGAEQVADLGPGTLLGQDAAVFDLGATTDDARLFHHAIPNDREPWDTGIVPIYELGDQDSGASRIWFFEWNDQIWAALVNTPLTDDLQDAVTWANAIFDAARTEDAR